MHFARGAPSLSELWVMGARNEWQRGPGDQGQSMPITVALPNDRGSQGDLITAWDAAHVSQSPGFMDRVLVDFDLELRR